MSKYHNLANILITYTIILETLIPSLQDGIDFTLAFQVVLQMHDMLNPWKPKIKLLIYYKDSFVQQNACQERSSNTYVPILLKNLQIKLLRNRQIKRGLNENLVHFILPN